GESRSTTPPVLSAAHQVSTLLSGEVGSVCEMRAKARALEMSWHGFGEQEMRRNEHREHPRGLADLLLPYALIEDGILLQQDGSLLTGWSFRGPDMMSASHAEMNALSARLNQCLRLGSGWMVQCDAIRTCAPGYPDQGAFPDSVTRMIDDERRQQFMAEEAHFESEYFVTLTYLPPVEAEERAKGWMFEGDSAHRMGRGADLVIERFRSRVDAFE